MELILYIVLGSVAFWLGWHARGIIFLANIAQNPEKVIKMLEEIKRINDSDIKEVVGNKGTELSIEKVGNDLYAYAKDTNQFVAQGSDLKSLLESAHKRFPGRVFFGNIPEDNPAKDLV